MQKDPQIFCSRNFKYQDFIDCSDTHRLTKVENLPEMSATFDFIDQLAQEILEPCLKKFGCLKLTYGFCSQLLAREIKKNGGGIYPPLDQHSSMERNKKGELICERGGFASDFHCLPTPSLDVAKFIVSELNFDRLYYYGEGRPIHVSVNKSGARQIVIMEKVNTKVVPKRINSRRFMEM
jgi:hypothetical protein